MILIMKMFYCKYDGELKLFITVLHRYFRSERGATAVMNALRLVPLMSLRRPHLLYMQEAQRGRAALYDSRVREVLPRRVHRQLRPDRAREPRFPLLHPRLPHLLHRQPQQLHHLQR